MNRGLEILDPPAGSLDAAVPVIAWRGTVSPDWIDLNNHMNSMAYYNLLHPNSRAIFHLLGIDAGYLERGLSIFQREFRLSYERELRLGDPIEIRSWLIEHDDKRLHHFHELWNTRDGYRAAFIEYMSFHVDIAARRTGPFPSDVMQRLEAVAAAFAKVAQPEGVGGVIRIPRKSKPDEENVQ